MCLLGLLEVSFHKESRPSHPNSEQNERGGLCVLHYIDTNMGDQEQTTDIIDSSVHHHSITWTIVNFSNMSEHFVLAHPFGERMEPIFESRIFKFESSNSCWRICLYSNYYKGDHGKSFVVFELKCESEDPDIYVATPTMVLIDSAGEMKLMQKERFPPYFRQSFMINRQEILRDKNMYLPNDVLTLKCDLVVECKTKAVDIESRLEGRKVLKIPVDFEVMSEEKLKFRDVIIHCDGSKFRVHPQILAAESRVFASMFQPKLMENIENKVDIKDIKAATMERLLCYIYDKKIELLLPGDYMDLYKAADKYELLELKQHCASVIVINLNAKVVCEVAKLADMHNDSSLFTSVKNFVGNYVNKETFVTTEAFVDFKQISPVMANRLISS